MRNILVYLLAVNLLGFMLMGWDKRQAKRDGWRVKEKILFLLALAGGSLGVLYGMHRCVHKTKHLSFKLGIPVIILIQAAAVVWLGFFGDFSFLCI